MCGEVGWGLTEYALADQDAVGHLSEGVVEGAPEVAGRVASLALLLEAVGTVDHARLVVAPQQEEGGRMRDLVAEEERRRLDGLLPAVDVV